MATEALRAEPLRVPVPLPVSPGILADNKPAAPADKPDMLRANAAGRPVMVDRKKNVLYGYVVAQLGPFKSPGRGEFDQASLDKLVELSAPFTQGLKSRFSHPTECNDGLGSYLGRSKNWFMSTTKNAAGEIIPAVRGDLHFDPTSLQPGPDGGKPLGVYVMDLAESDSEAISSSLVVRVNKEYRLDDRGSRLTGADGQELPPLWRPTRLMGSDIVDIGDAVDGLLSTDGLPNAALWKGVEFLNGMFEDSTREEVSERLTGFVERYIEMRFPSEMTPVPAPVSTPEIAAATVVDAAPLAPAPDAEPGDAVADILARRRKQRIRELEAAS